MNHVVSKTSAPRAQLKSQSVRALRANRPTYIALEGVKGVGKGAVLRWLTRELKRRGVSYVSLNPTQSLSADHHWEQIDRALPLRHLDWWREHLYAARSQLHALSAAHTIESARESARPVELILGDRSILTSLVTRWPDTPSSESVEMRYREVRRLESEIPIPDHILYLDAPFDVIESRIANRSRRYGLEDEARVRLVEAHEAYQRLERDPIAPLSGIKWHTIDASLNLSMVRDATLNIVLEVMGELRS